MFLRVGTFFTITFNGRIKLNFSKIFYFFKVKYIRFFSFLHLSNKIFYII